MNENLISSISYTDKDFNSIYTELLDLAKKITNKWDPSLSNESDPGVILLKLNAIIADKNNYNIDKNVLECFPLSVTQEGNARKLYDLLGYKMGWYKSATVPVSFLLKDKTILNDNSGPVVIPLFTQIQDEAKEINYVTLEQVALYEINAKTPVTVSAMQGTLKYYEINGSKDIPLSSLDDDNRIYLNDINIAENGIFIKGNADVNWFQWESVNNIVSHDSSSSIYEFGVLPNSNTCYIQFPSDVINIVNGGYLNIAYVISSGTDGNIKRNILTTFMNNIEYAGEDGVNIVVNDKIRIIQSMATNSGSNPETLTEAFNNYKKTVGTFETLVTLRDYINYLYNLKIDNEFYICNCVVTDRTTDVNTSAWVQTWQPTLEKKDLIIKESQAKEHEGEPVMTPFDLCLYLVGEGIGLNVPDLETYNESFKTPDSNDIVNVKYLIQNKIENVKAIQHDLLTPFDLYGDGLPIDNTKTTLPYKTIFNNLFKLKGNIITYKKLTSQEIENLQENVRDALYTNYNSRKVNFGEKVDYQNLIDTIKKSDTRISNVILDIPTYDIRRQNVNTNQLELMTDEEKIDLIAKMVLAGNVQLLKFDDNFNLEFGQSTVKYPNINIDGSAKDVISKITTETLIPISTEETTVRENEVIQIYAPNFITLKSFSTYVKYKLNISLYEIHSDINVTSGKLLSGSEIQSGSKIAGNDITTYTTLTSDTTLVSGDIIVSGSKLESGSIVNDKTYYAQIAKNTNYKLALGESIDIKYTDSNGATQTTILTEGEIINANITLTTEPSQADTSDNFKILQSGQSIDIKTLNISKLPEKTNFYLVLNSDLELGKNEKYVLQENEYLIYTDSSTTELIILGSGTLIRNDNEKIFTWEIRPTQTKDIDKLDSGDFSNIEWGILDVELTIQELDIYTLAEGATIKLNSGNYILTNDAQKIITDLITIQSQGEIITLQPYCSETSGVDYWYAISRLNLNSTYLSPQELKDGQLVKLYYYDEETDSSYSDTSWGGDIYTISTNDKANLNNHTLEWTSIPGYAYSVNTEFTDKYLFQNSYIAFNSITVMSGGKNLNAKVANLLGVFKYILKVYSFSKNEDQTIDISRDSNNNLTLTPEIFASNNNEINLYFNFDSNTSYIVPVSINIALLNDDTIIGNKIVSIQGIDADGNIINNIIDYNTTDNLNKITINGSYYMSNSGTSIVGIKITPKVYNGSGYVKTSLGSSDSITIGKINKVDTYNEDEIGLSSDNFANILTRIDTILSDYSSILKNTSKIKFNWAYRVPESDKVIKPLEAESFWNINHLYNKITLPQIDFENYELSVVN